MIMIDTNLLIGEINGELGASDLEYRTSIFNTHSCMILTVVLMETYSPILHQSRQVYKKDYGKFTRNDAIVIIARVHETLTHLVEECAIKYEEPDVEIVVSQMMLLSGLDWVDCYLIYKAYKVGCSVATRDKQLVKLLELNGLSVAGQGSVSSGIRRLKLED